MKLPFSSMFNVNVKLMLQKRRVIFTFYLLWLLPLAMLIFAIKEKSQSLDELSSEVKFMRIRAERTLEMQKDRNAFFKKYGQADRYYLDHVLEVATFLKPEVEALELVYGHPAFESCETVKKRLNFLTKGKNRLIFSEENRQFKNNIEELNLLQKRPIEINTEDLKHLLSLVEGVSIGEYQPSHMSPQLIIRRLTLRRKKLAERETFLLEMHLIKREPVK